MNVKVWCVVMKMRVLDADKAGRGDEDSARWSSREMLRRRRCAQTGYLLRIAGGPRQPPGLLQDEDRPGDVVRRALDLIRRESQELRSAVREFQRQIRAAGMVAVGPAGHHAAHEIHHRRSHARQHGLAAAAWVQAARRLRRAPRATTQFRGVEGRYRAAEGAVIRLSLNAEIKAKTLIRRAEPRARALVM